MEPTWLPTAAGARTNQETATLSSQQDRELLTKHVQIYCKALDKINSCLEHHLQSRMELKTLQDLHTVLIENRLDSEPREDIRFQSEQAIPDDVKCPVCFELYSGKILQCLNGHCVCGQCCFNMTSCPECRVSYFGEGDSWRMVRNRALENLIATVIKVDCPNELYGCRERLKCKELYGHLKLCQYKKKSEELIKVEDDIDLLKETIKSEELRMDKLNKTVIETGQQWNNISTNHPNRLTVIQVKSQHQVLKKEMQKCDLNIKIKSLVYFK